MNQSVEAPKLCPRCDELRQIRPHYKLCDPCEMEVLRVWHDRLHDNQEAQRVA
ncbi:MAG: hypothetical protein OHK0011_00920 [Turneriella sp.]